MPCRRFSYASFLMLAALGGMFAGCHRDTGAAPDAQVQALQVSSELDRTKKKLATTEKESAAKDDAVLAIAHGALRTQMLHQVQTILATFDLSRLPTVTE